MKKSSFLQDGQNLKSDIVFFLFFFKIHVHRANSLHRSLATFSRFYLRSYQRSSQGQIISLVEYDTESEIYYLACAYVSGCDLRVFKGVANIDTIKCTLKPKGQTSM